MNLKNVRVAPKLWLTILGLLVVMLLANLWVRSNTEQALRQSLEDIQQIERKIGLAQHMRGAASASMEMGIAQFATNENRLQQELEKRFVKRMQISDAAQKAMAEALKTEQDREQFAQVLKVRAEVVALRSKAETELDLEDYNARANFSFGEYAAIGDKYSQAFDTFIQVQNEQLASITQLAQERRQQSLLFGWTIAGLLLLLGVFMARWLVRTITEPLREAVQLTQAIGEGNLNVAIHNERQDEFGQLLNALQSMAGRLRSVVGEVRVGVEAVSSAAGQIASGNQDLSARTEQTAANLEETASSMEELTATVTQSADIARQANQLASTAVQTAERGGAVVAQVVESMEQINASSRKIGDIIGVIDGIAFQTNILALNAAVEAARAGEQGRGFAVVAAEVRSLAGRSAEAAKQIKALIATSVSNVQNGSTQVGLAGENMQAIVSSVRRVTDLIGEITASSTEQRDGIAQVNQAVNNLDQMTQQNAALVEESSAAAKAMHEQAQRLTSVVSVFNIGQSAARTEPVLAAVKPAPSKPEPKSEPVLTKASPVPPAPAAVKPVAPQPRKKVEPATNAEGDWESF